jgi:CheY-like chemotaxis protein
MVDTQREHETILLVEDDELLLNLLRAVFERKGYAVLTAKNGLEAVDLYAKHQDEVSLVLSDLNMPKLGGREAYKQLKQINPDVKMILASAYWSSTLRESLIAEGAKDFLPKPYSPVEIVKKADNILSA